MNFFAALTILHLTPTSVDKGKVPLSILIYLGRKRHFVMNWPVLQMDYKSDMSSTAGLHFCAQYWIYLEDDLLPALGDVTDEREERPEK